MTKVALSSARIARDTICEKYNLHVGKEDDSQKHAPWCPKLYPGDHEEVDATWIISWEEGVDYEFVYDEDLQQTMLMYLRLHVDTHNLQVTHRIEAVNHFVLALYAEPLR